VFRSLVWSSLSARRARLALALMAVTLGVGVATALATLAIEVGDDLARTLRASGPNFVVLPAGARWPVDVGGASLKPARAGLSLPESTLAALKQSFWKNNLLEAAPEIAVTARLGGADVPLVGTWFDRVIRTRDGVWRTGLARLRPNWTVEGRWPGEQGDEVALGRELATRLGLEVGDGVKLTLEGRTHRARITGIVEADGLESRRAWAPLEHVRALAGRPEGLDRVWLSALVRPAPRTPPPDPARDPAGYERYKCSAYPFNVAEELAGRIPDAEVLPASEVMAGEGHVVERLNMLMLLLALAALVASTLGLLSTTTATVVERGVELGLLRALGASSRQIAALLLGETLLVSVAGGALGWLLGTLAAAAIRGESFGAGTTMNPLLLPVALMLSLGVAAAGTIGPLRMALRLDPATVLRG
jgi:putative ABC transport system permease protein